MSKLKLKTLLNQSVTPERLRLILANWEKVRKNEDFTCAGIKRLTNRFKIYFTLLIEHAIYEQ